MKATASTCSSLTMSTMRSRHARLTSARTGLREYGTLAGAIVKATGSGDGHG
jgi:hypothetical protein